MNNFARIKNSCKIHVTVMAAKKQKFYVVWKGRERGVFDNWEDCKKQTHGFPDPAYKSFETKAEAMAALAGSSKQYIGQGSKESVPQLSKEKLQLLGKPIADSISVDGAWNTASGLIEYKGVYTATGKVLFLQGPFRNGTNNIAEFLAIVHALAYCQKHNLSTPIYSDSRNAIGWVRFKKAKTNLAPAADNKTLFELIHRAEQWLQNNKYTNKVLKWETKAWGENPADFGRK